MKTIACLICLLTATLAVAQQPMNVEGKPVSAKTAKALVKQGKVFYLTAGMPLRGLSDNAKQCRERVQKEFGFSYYTVSGDVNTPENNKRISDFNAVIKKHIASKHGTDWEKQLDAKLEACNKEP